MTQFVYYPVVLYPNPQNSFKVYQMNFTRRADVLNIYKNNERYYFKHEIGNADTPEILADKLYDNANYAWIILQFNDIVNPFEDWCKSSSELHSFILEKYENPYKVTRWIDIDSGFMVDPSFYPNDKLLPITNYEYEEILNERKREIKLPLPEVARSIAYLHKQTFQ